MADGVSPPIGKGTGILAADDIVTGVTKLAPPVVGDAAGAAVLLVSSDAPGRKAEDVVGIVTLARLVQLRKQAKEPA